MSIWLPMLASFHAFITWQLPRIACYWLISLMWLPGIVKADVVQPSMVIIIDDLGYNLANGLGIINLPGPITLAVMPHTPFGEALARRGAALDKEIMLHAPMQNHSDKKLGPGGLTANMSEGHFKSILREAVASVPFAEGINNHMGSALTEKPVPMKWTMDVANELGLFFVDSRTSAKSIAWQQAKRSNTPSLRRDVFLDNEVTDEALERQFQQAMQVALKHEYSVLIGHPYPETIDFLERSLSKLDEAGIKLVSASALIWQLQPHLNAL